MRTSQKRKAAFKEKINKLEETLKEEQARSKEYLNRLKYLQADFENYRKRVEKEFYRETQRSNEKLISNLLNVLDDLERAIETGKTTKNVIGLLEGIQMVYKNILVILEREGLVSIEAVGKHFDPNTHEVLAKVPKKTCEEGIVIEEVRKGFMFKGKVMRPSIVKITCKVEGSVEK